MNDELKQILARKHSNRSIQQSTTQQSTTQQSTTQQSTIQQSTINSIKPTHVNIPPINPINPKKTKEDWIQYLESCGYDQSHEIANHILSCQQIVDDLNHTILLTNHNRFIEPRSLCNEYTLIIQDIENNVFYRSDIRQVIPFWTYEEWNHKKQKHTSYSHYLSIHFLANDHVDPSFMSFPSPPESPQLSPQLSPQSSPRSDQSSSLSPQSSPRSNKPKNNDLEAFFYVSQEEVKSIYAYWEYVNPNQFISFLTPNMELIATKTNDVLHDMSAESTIFSEALTNFTNESRSII